MLKKDQETSREDHNSSSREPDDGMTFILPQDMHGMSRKRKPLLILKLHHVRLITCSAKRSRGINIASWDKGGAMK